MTCPPEHAHGATGHCYAAHKCRCDDCMEGKRLAVAYWRHRSATRDVKDYTPVSATKARAHLRDLVASGATLTTIASSIGASRNTLACILAGQPRARAYLVEAILGVSVPRGKTIPAEGTRRRIQACYCMGWSSGDIERVTGLTHGAVVKILAGVPRVKPDTARLVDEFYRRHAYVHAPVSQGCTKAVDRAAAEGWVPAAAWDDIDTDKRPHSVWVSGKEAA